MHCPTVQPEQAQTKANHRSRRRDRLKPRGWKSWPPCLRGTRAALGVKHQNWGLLRPFSREWCFCVTPSLAKLTSWPKECKCFHSESVQLLEGLERKHMGCCSTLTITMCPCGKAIYLLLSALSFEDLLDSTALFRGGVTAQRQRLPRGQENQETWAPVPGELPGESPICSTTAGEARRIVSGECVA